MRVHTAVTGVLGVVAGVGTAIGQEVYAATRGIGFDAFGAVSTVQTDYGQRNRGAMFGLDATRHLQHFGLFNPGMEVRLGLAPGPVVSQTTMFVGPRLERRVGRAHVYGDFLVGRGTLGVAGTSTSGGAFAYGGGVDFDLGHRWAIRADYTQESWKLATETNRLTPARLSVGVVWRFNFGKK